MKKHFLSFSMFAIVLYSASSCATILSGTKADIKVTSSVPNSKVYSVNKEEQLTELGSTPCIVTIKKKTPYLVVKTEGYSDAKYDVKANAKLNPIYFLNILNLSIGMWIDLGTGAAIKTEKEVNFEMKKNN